MLNSTNDKRFSTELLDEAMKELLDVCQEYNDKFADRQRPLKHQQQQDGTRSARRNADHELSTNSKHRTLTNMNELLDDKDNQHSNAPSKCDSRTPNGRPPGAAHSPFKSYEKCDALSPPTAKLDKSNSASIENLQQRQCKLQEQLDQVLKIARTLEAKQNKILKNILEDGAASTFNSKLELDDDEDSELIEFQQIENELRISELNRQLGNIQEEIRLKLYKRLLTKTSNGTKSNKERQQAALSHEPSAMRRNSAQTDESTPPSSSCSDEQTASSSISTSEINSRMYFETDLTDQFDRCSITKTMISSPKSSTKSIDQADSKLATRRNRASQNEPTSLTKTCNQEDGKINDLSSALDSSHNYETLNLPKTSDERSFPLQASTNQNVQRHSNQHEEHSVSIMSNYAPNGLRATNDLERIDEGEEEENDYYSNSSMFRKIYEEKLSPLLQAADNSRSQTSDKSQRVGLDAKDAAASSKNQTNGAELEQTPKAKVQKDNRFDISNVNSVRRANRPLTMYMPKPDEDIDLLELVQAMGHDLDIILDDIRLDSSSACGYLFKSCSNNTKKWRKRFFHFDRKMKTLSYYESEEQLVKKSGTPKCVVSFDEIGDVYVDHRLSELSEKQKGSKRKSYIFILATIKRKYVLASPRAETMRAWIDILFTAAKADDYFQQLEDYGYPSDCPDF